MTVGDATSVSAGGVTFTYTAAAGVANPETVANSVGTALTAASTLISAGTLSIARGGVTTTYTTTAASTSESVQTLINAINTGATSGVGVAGLWSAGGAATGLRAALIGGQLQFTDTAGNNNLAVTGEATTIVAGETVAVLPLRQFKT